MSIKESLYSIPNLKKGLFISRPNRFVGEIEDNGHKELAHIHDPGRLKELLRKNAEILFTESNGKLKYYIKAIKTNTEWVLIDTAQHSKIAMYIFKYLDEFKTAKNIKKEVKIGKSRIDFVIDGVPLEVKGVSLVENGIALFPDAPTERGTRHVNEIIDHNGMLLFLVFRTAKKFKPHKEIDPSFYNTLSKARKKGLPIIAARISFDGKMLYYNGKIPLGLF